MWAGSGAQAAAGPLLRLRASLCSPSAKHSCAMSVTSNGMTFPTWQLPGGCLLMPFGTADLKGNSWLRPSSVCLQVWLLISIFILELKGRYVWRLVSPSQHLSSFPSPVCTVRTSQRLESSVHAEEVWSGGKLGQRCQQTFMREPT